MSLRRSAPAALLVVLLGLTLLAPASTASAASAPVEPYARYVPQTMCAPKAKPGTKVLAGFVVRWYGGGQGAISRPCGSGGRSEHKEGRAWDWTLNVAKAADRARAQKFLKRVFATDARGNRHAQARRMGIMYVIWNDRIYSAYNQFRARPYLSSGCAKLSRCSKTLRHRDHMHISLNWRGARGQTSWYAGRR